MVLRYLKGIKNQCWKFRVEGKSSVNITDFDWKGDEWDHMFCTEILFQLGNATTGWEAKQQYTVGKSSTDAGYMALSEAIEDLFEMSHE
jgi:hypothetical protein